MIIRPGRCLEVKAKYTKAQKAWLSALPSAVRRCYGRQAREEREILRATRKMNWPLGGGGLRACARMMAKRSREELPLVYR